MAVEAMLDMAYPVLATNQARRTMPRHSVVRDEHLTRTAASQELSSRSHLVPSARVRPATSCHASGMAVDAILDMAYPVLAANQARRTITRYMSEHNDFLPCHANVVLSKSSITVLPRVALVMSLLEPRIRTSRRPIE